MALLEVSQVVKTCCHSFTVGPVNLQLSRGEVLSVTGPAGAGKTTLLRLLWGFLRPDAGTISVMGMTPHLEQVRVRRKVGFVGDSLRLREWMSAEQHLSFTAGFYPTFDCQHARDLLDRLGVRARNSVGKLSEAEKVKLALVAALAHRPDLLILDEPTSDLDSRARDEVSELLREQSKLGVGIIFSNPPSEALEQTADSVLRLDAGSPLYDSPYTPTPERRLRVGRFDRKTMPA